MLAAGLIVLLIGFATAMAVQTWRIARERDRANAELDRANVERDRAARAAVKSARVTEFLKGMFDVSRPGEALGNSITARQNPRERGEGHRREAFQRPGASG